MGGLVGVLDGWMDGWQIYGQMDGQIKTETKSIPIAEMRFNVEVDFINMTILPLLDNVG